MTARFRTPAQDALLYFLEAMRAQAEIQSDRPDLFINLTQKSEDFETGRLACRPNPKNSRVVRDWTACVVTIEGQQERGRPQVLLAVPAEVRFDAEGFYTLRPPGQTGVQRLPSVPIEILAQQNIDRSGFILGPIEEADRWLLKQRGQFDHAVKHADWSHWWRLSLGLVAAVMQCDTHVIGALEDKLGRGAQVTFRVVEAVDCPVMLRSISSVLKTASELKRMPPLLNAWLSRSSRTVSTGNVKEQVDCSARFTAVMDNYDAGGARRAFPLDPSQREAVLFGLSPALVTPVQGPPGSGKTALLRAFTAAMMVNAVLEEKPAPPLILATGATNLAVVNIIKDFAGAALPVVKGQETADPTLASRWIPQAPSFGWFRPAKSYIEMIRRAGGKSGDLELAQNSPVDLQNLPILDHSLSEAERLAGKDVGEAGLAFRTNVFGTAAPIDAMFNGETTSADIMNNATYWMRGFYAFSSGLDGRSVNRAPLRSLRDLQTALRGAMAEMRQILMKNVAAQHHVNAAFRKVLGAPRPVHIDELVDALWTASYKHAFGFCDNLKLEAAMELVRTTATHLMSDLAAGHSPGNPEDARKFGVNAQALFDATQAVLDLGPRAAAFHLAARYWEGDFLVTRISRELNPAAFSRNLKLLGDAKGPTAVLRESMREVLALGPVIVSTLYALPTMFKFRDITEAGFEIADVLIIDEASQCQPEMIAPSIAYAKKALVVGDTEQLEPVYKLTSQHDEELQSSILGTTGADGLPKDLRVTQGNAMLTAVRAAETKHLMLRGHYRCVPEIMDFFSRLCYQQRLVPMREARLDSENFGFAPPVGIHVAPSEARRLGSGSLDNRTEAKSIADYLVRNADLIEALYDAPIEKCVGVLTPYAGQRGALVSELRRGFALRGRLFSASREDASLEAYKSAGENFTYTLKFGPRPDITRSMTIGTIHQFQGGQKKMIIISLTADAISKDTLPGFIDRSANLLNVATSRPQESLIVFTTPEMMSRLPELMKTPTSLFLTWMRRKATKLEMPAPLQPLTVDTKQIREREAGEFIRAEREAIDISKLQPSRLAPGARGVQEGERSAWPPAALDAPPAAVALPTTTGTTQPVTESGLPKDIFRDTGENYGFHGSPPEIEMPPIEAYIDDLEAMVNFERNDSELDTLFAPPATHELIDPEFEPVPADHAPPPFPEDQWAHLLEAAGEKERLVPAITGGVVAPGILDPRSPFNSSFFANGTRPPDRLPEDIAFPI